jgi:hypothetical protein
MYFKWDYVRDAVGSQRLPAYRARAQNRSMTDLRTPVSTDLDSPEAETERIMRTGPIWLAAVTISAAMLLGPAVAAGWRPDDLPAPFDAAWWFSAVIAAVGVGLLVWASCPVPGFTLDRAHRQKVFSIRVGIVLSLGGIVLGGVAVLLA